MLNVVSVGVLPLVSRNQRVVGRVQYRNETPRRVLLLPSGLKEAETVCSRAAGDDHAIDAPVSAVIISVAVCEIRGV